MKHLKCLLVFAAGAFFAAACPAQPSGLLDGLAVVVNDSVITVLQVQDQILSQLKTLENLYGRGTPRFYEEADKLQRDELELMERGKLILNDFASGEYTTNWVDDAVEASIKKDLKKTFGGSRNKLVATLQAEGRTYEDYRKQMRENIIIGAMADLHTGTGKIIISPLAIEKYYNDHADSYKVEDHVKLRMIQIPEPAGSPPGTARQLAAEILRKIDSGVPFAEMAVVNSSGPERAAGGDCGWVDRKRFVKELTDAAFSLKPGEHTLVEVPDQRNQGVICYLLMVEDVRPAHVSPLSEVQADIERTLQAQRGKVIEDQWIKRLEDKSRVQTF
jgi:parvulin-like peptidyl-prolyl isomerase